MRVYLEHPNVESIAIRRVRDALARYAPPSVDVVPDESAAELVVLHVNGRVEATTRKAQDLKQRGQRVAIMQYVLRSSQKPFTHDWLRLWDTADAIWSYLDLRSLCHADGQVYAFGERFYCAPLGVDPAFLADVDADRSRIWTIGTVGLGWLQESVRESHRAARMISGMSWHVGPLRGRQDVAVFDEISDEALAALYRSTRFVSGLRRVEGFELPAAEAACQGARPILFRQPHYVDWYRGLATFIEEEDREGVQHALVTLLAAPYVPMGAQAIADARARFRWQPLVEGFWGRLL